ncbi:hypothetical protein QUA41_08310 [Microcoleus sp. Pol11C1]|uniref:hypothetical protein n=1 Tax=unclassified Microcoleus TaxID=2642155 RepID=UPI002FD6172E
MDGRSGFWLIGRSNLREMCDRIFVDGRSNLREMCDRIFVLIGTIGFLGLWAIGFFVDRAIDFERNVTSGFLLIGRSILRGMCDRAISCSPISD